MANDYSKTASSQSRLMNKRKPDLILIARSCHVELTGDEEKKEIAEKIQKAQKKWIAKIGKLQEGEY